MPQVIHVPAGVSVLAIQRALAGTRAGQIALAFPLNEPCAAVTAEAMHGLRAHCDALDKDVVVIGGDAQLRAAAVAAGFPAATSLDEWEATQPRIAAIMPVHRDAGDEWEAPHLTLVPLRDATDDAGDPFDPFDDMPPEFVRELMAREGGYGEAGLEDAAGDMPSDELSDEDALRAAHERYEERITNAIRHTGGLSVGRPPSPPISSLSGGAAEARDESDPEASTFL